MDKAISVIIPTYNRRDSTDQAVASVVCANPDLVEIIVVDDNGSEPYSYPNLTNSHGIIVTVVRSDVNGGPGLARKKGVEHCTGDLVAFLDSDDVFDHKWLDTVLAEVSCEKTTRPNRLAFIGMAEGSSNFVRCVSRTISALPKGISGVACRLAMTMMNPFCTGSVVASREICHFHQSLRYCEDYYTNVLAVFEAEHVVVFRMTACRVSRNNNKEFHAGESKKYRDMRRGEMRVKVFMLRSKLFPVVYRALLPVGILFMLCRYAAQSLGRRIVLLARRGNA